MLMASPTFPLAGHIRPILTRLRAGFFITLKRDSASKPDWSIAFRGRAERERLRDWLRDWLRGQGERSPSSSTMPPITAPRRLIDEMFEIEKRVKSEERSAGGSRPLRM